MITMHGFFDLKDVDSEVTFKRVFDDFAEHLQECQLITSYKVMRRRPDVNYDSNPPSTTCYICMDFVDMAHTQKCWDYIEKNDAVSGLLHRHVYSKITNYSFFLSEEMAT